jgi:nicotinate-nucleotide adenylyltransferase
LVSNLEESIGYGNSYDTLKYLISHLPKTHFTWIMGIDCLKDFHLWENYDTLPKLVDMMIFNRQGSEDLLNSTIAGKLLMEKYMDKVTFIQEKLSNLSSTEIRSEKRKMDKRHELLGLIIKLLEDKKAENIQIMDISKMEHLADHNDLCRRALQQKCRRNS